MILDSSAIIAIVSRDSGDANLMTKLARRPLLCVGEDFPQTDLDLA